jgi:hypothetical protein
LLSKGPRPGATGGGLVRANGFTVEVKPIQDPDGSAEMICQAIIRSPQGKIIFEHREWGVEIDPITGKDVNGDGFADAVLEGFSGGGVHCCRTYFIVSLGKNPGLVATIENSSSASFEDLSRNGKVEILIRDGGFDGSFGLNHAFSPFPLLIVRLSGSRFEDVGSQFWSIYKKEIQQARAKLKTADLRRFVQSNPTEIYNDDTETETHILEIVLDYLYAGHPKESRATLNTLWPPASQNETWVQMVNGYCSGLRASLQLESHSPCTDP